MDTATAAVRSVLGLVPTSASVNPPAFQYDSLVHNDDIRLLKLHATNGQDDVIRGSLHHFRLGGHDQPAYRALSYTWGTDVARFDLQMESNMTNASSSVLKVRNSLWNALKALQDDASDGWVWCDAICINQNSDSERNHQVRLMADVYTNANIVCVWVKSAGEDVNIKKIRKSIEGLRRLIAKPATGHSSTLGTHDDLKLFHWRTSVTKAYDDLLHFCNLNYWRRKWIIQELLHAKSVVLCSESDQIPMQELEQLLEWLAEIEPTLDGPSNPVALLATPAALLTRQRRTRRTSPSDSLYILIERWAENQCQDPSDHVYAVYSLVGEHRRHLPIDYTSTPIEKFAAVLRFVRDHETLPAKDLPAFVSLLGRLLEINLDRAMSGSEGMDSLRLTTSVSMYGIERLDKSDDSRRLRKTVEPLQPIINYTLSGPSWNQGLDARQRSGGGTYTTSRQDMVCFRTTGSRYRGLASCRLDNTDVAIRLPTTDLALIVRADAGGDSRIVGTAYLFNFANSPREEADHEALALARLDSAAVGRAYGHLSLSCADLIYLMVVTSPTRHLEARSPTASGPPQVIQRGVRYSRYCWFGGCVGIEALGVCMVATCELLGKCCMGLCGVLDECCKNSDGPNQTTQADPNPMRTNPARTNITRTGRTRSLASVYASESEGEWSITVNYS